MKKPKFSISSAIITVVALTLPMTASADAAYDALKSQVEMLQKQLEQIREEMKHYREKNVSRKEITELKKDVKEARKEVKKARQEAKEARNEVKEAAEWKNPNTLIHMAGYADVGYTDQENANGSFNVGNFSPIFHFQYRDLALIESEVEFGIDPDGSTSIELEYMTIDLFLNDYMALIAGKFLSPVGQFRQNLHPGWINKLPSAPPGFGEDGAAPISDIGVQVRGGFPVGDMFANYAVYVANGPELTSMTNNNGISFSLEAIEAEGFGRDMGGNKVFGGRVGFLPFSELEVGVSGVTGQASVTRLKNNVTGITTNLGKETSRNYDVAGADFVWHHKALNVRGEYVQTRIGAASSGMTPSPGGFWSTWYAQAAYRLKPTKFEGVYRYAHFNAPGGELDQRQNTIGVNYLFTSSIMAKLAYEFNEGMRGNISDDNRWLLQLAYGF